jgi:transposase
VSDLYAAQRGHAELWQVCLAHQLRDLRYAVEAGDAVFAPRLKALLLRAVVLARRRHALKASTRLEYRRRLERELDHILALQPSHRRGQRLRQRYLAVRDSLLTFPGAPGRAAGQQRQRTRSAVNGGVDFPLGSGGFANEPQHPRRAA